MKPAQARCSGSSRYILTAVLFAPLAFLAGCGGETATEASALQSKQASLIKVSAAQTASVIGISKVSETRVSRTVFDYVFRVSLRNDSGAQLNDVNAVLTTVGAGATIIDGSSRAGNMNAGATVVSQDTITIRQDRSLPFDQSALVWSVSATLPPSGNGLPGNPGDNANSRIADVDTNETYAPSEYSTDPSGTRILRTLIAIAIDNAATVQQINMLLERINGSIVYSSAGSGVIHVRIPDPLTLGALQTLMSQISSDAAVDFVIETVVPGADQLPSQQTPLSRLHHHLAVRGGAAWNARSAVAQGSAPNLIISDFFGNGIPNADNTVTFLNGPDFVTTVPNVHGYHVLGIIAGSFGGTDARGDVTGMYPGPAPLKTTVIDLQASQPPYEARIAKQIQTIVAGGARVVLNTSLNNGAMKTSNSDRYSTVWGEYWARLIRGVNQQAANSIIEDSYIHSGSAGNINPAQNARIAFHNSAWNAATLPARFGPPLARFNNTLVVENRRGIEKPNQEFTTGCTLSASSFSSGNISAIGSWENGLGIWSFLDSASSAGSTFINAFGQVQQVEGTSMAAPQVAGLAAYLWAIRPALKASEITQIILTNPHEASLACTGSPAIDAYAATLALDDAAGLNNADPQRIPVRLALLDVAGNDKQFNVEDVAAYLDALFPTTSASDADYSRFDLNGDGFTGGARTARFNLNIDYEPSGRTSKYTQISLAQNGTILRKSNGNPLDETALTDFEILCYYVNSNLFTGTAQEISTALANKSNALGRVISCSERVVILNVNASNPNWGGLPATIVLSNFVPRFPATSAGNSATCTNQGEPPGERGTPVFSAAVPDRTAIFAAIDVVGVPWLNSGGVSNRRNCSSFFAKVGQQVWINATARAVFGFGSTVVSDWEYQVRYTSGDSTGLGKQCTIGNVPGSGFFAAAFNDPSCTHQETVRIRD